MAFGAFAPMPLRLGGSAAEGWSAEQHARLAESVASMYTVGRFAVLRYSKSGSTVTVLSYVGRDGVGVQHAPTPVVNGTGDVTWSWAAQWEDALGVSHVLRLIGAMACSNDPGGGVNARCVGTNTSYHGRTIAVVTVNSTSDAAVDAPVTLIVKALEARSPAEYGAASDKRASRAEGAIPYAWHWYEHFRAGMGTAYTAEDRATIQHAENLAHARAEAAMSRAAERLSHGGAPHTSDETLARWAEILDVQWLESEPNETVRARCAGKYRLASGNDYVSVDQACANILGAAYVRIWVVEGTDLATPPVPTMWPGVNPGPASYSLGGGAWLSARAHLVVETVRPPGLSESDFLRLVNGDLFAMLQATLPAWVTFNWCVGPLSSGFLLDLSDLDFTGLAP